jgi:NNP family nitrate/nitrite transporter-like MFS transporter
MAPLTDKVPDLDAVSVEEGAPEDKEWYVTLRIDDDCSILFTCSCLINDLLTYRKKYNEYKIATDPDQNDKATEIKMCSFARPHMRAFHCAWWGFFIAFFIWFSIAPLLGEIRKTLHLTKKQVWTSNIVGVAGTILMRFLLGPLCDKFGARTLFAVVLIMASIPTACTGLVNSATGLAMLRLFIGIAGGSFVMCQYWTSTMFTKEVVGTVNGIVAGWGNLGGGVTQLVMGSALFPLFKNVFYNHNAELAW